MNYWATDSDAAFDSGHYVEEWELHRLAELAEPVRQLLSGEAARGNKITSITKHFVQLRQPPSCGVLALPDGLTFCTPIQHTGVRVWDGDEEGVIVCLATGDRVYPSGLEPAGASVVAESAA